MSTCCESNVNCCQKNSIPSTSQVDSIDHSSPNVDTNSSNLDTNVNNSNDIESNLATDPTSSSSSSDSVRKPRFVGRGTKRNVVTIKRGQGRFVGQVRSAKVVQGVPSEIRENPELNQMIAATLPLHYQFEIHKTIHKIAEHGASRVALQMPEGLLMFACAICDILERFAGVQTVVMGDVTYGACCVDDFTAAALGCDFLVHYGHSCLIPVDVTSSMGVLYVFVDISIDLSHLAASLRLNFPPSHRLCLFSTIQFAASLRHALALLQPHFSSLVVPQALPLSPGEVLGCTSPALPPAQCDAYVYIGDGRFHLESIMIANPGLPAFRYDPYTRVLSREAYDTAEMHRLRRAAVEAVRSARRVGLIMGTLGRQGAPRVVGHVERLLQRAGKEHALVLMSEITPARLEKFGDVDAWVQVACPRLSIDWGHQFSAPLLNPYEAEVALNEAETWREVYPQDFYSNSGGPWSVRYNKSNQV